LGKSRSGLRRLSNKKDFGDRSSPLFQTHKAILYLLLLNALVNNRLYGVFLTENAQKALSQ
jgi:hypothetical protein